MMEQLSKQDILHFLQDHRSPSARVLETNQRKQALHRHGHPFWPRENFNNRPAIQIEDQTHPEMVNSVPTAKS